MAQNIWVAAGDGDLDRVKVSRLLHFTPAIDFNLGAG